MRAVPPPSGWSRSRSTTSTPPSETRASPSPGRSRCISSTSRPHAPSISRIFRASPGLSPINSTLNGSLIVSLACRAWCPHVNWNSRYPAQAGCRREDASRAPAARYGGWAGRGDPRPARPRSGETLLRLYSVRYVPPSRNLYLIIRVCPVSRFRRSRSPPWPPRRRWMWMQNPAFVRSAIRASVPDCRALSRARLEHRPPVPPDAPFRSGRGGCQRWIRESTSPLGGESEPGQR